MPDEIPAPLDLRRLERQRQQVDALQSRRIETAALLAHEEAALVELTRVGATRTLVDAAAARVAELIARRDEVDVAIITGRDELEAAIRGVVPALDPATLVATLDAGVPVAMLPVRIETRFGDDRRSLRIRIYPDQIHLDAHEPELTDGEVAAAEWYWNERWTALADADVAEAAWNELAAQLNPGRARYIVDTMRPSNLAEAPAADPVFPGVARRASAWERAVRARALPHRWLAIGYQGSAEVFRCWSSPVRPELHTSPTPVGGAAPPTDDETPAVQAELAWAVDYDAAVAAGMALTVTPAEIAAGRSIANGLSRVVVVGVDWTTGPDAGSAALERLLAGHAATGDLAFVDPGTPTNNTGTARSGFSSAPAQRAAEWRPGAVGGDPAGVAPDRAAGRLAAALGVTPTALAVAPGAAATHHRTATALADALWEATGGYYARELLDPLGSDALTDSLRHHAAAHVFAGGPLPTIRVGKQPYGVLPVTARAFQSAPGNAAQAVIARVADGLRHLWAPLVARVPALGRAGEQRAPDEVLLDLLQRTPVPWSLRWREMTPPPQWSANDDLALLRTHQAPYVSLIMSQLGATTAARVQYLTATDDSHPLDVPLVANPEGARAGGAGPTAYLAEIAALARGGSDGRRQLNLRQNSIALLEALLAFAAVQELDRSAQVFHVLALEPTLQASVKLGVRTPHMVRVTDPEPAAGPATFATARQLADSTAPGTGRLVHDELQRLVGTRPGVELVHADALPARPIGRFLAAVESLDGVAADELEWAFRGVLDLYSSRLDAWLTSLADARLAAVRTRRPVGTYLGAYGWVEDLRPDSGNAAESLGYVLAPSIDHAVSAALLRSGHQAHVGDEAFELDISATRSRKALALLEGVAAGQPIAALLGYRIERGLRDHGIAGLTVPLRLAAPLKARDATHDVPLESVAARDVIDGVTLLAKFADAAQWQRVLAGDPALAAAQSRLAQVLTEVADVYDAVADVLVAETVHQIAAGNLDRAAAAAAALDRQERPVQPDVLRTPRDGPVVSTRVAVTLRSATAVRGWPRRGVRGTVEPRLDRWLGTVLGDPRALTAGVRLVRPPTATTDGEPAAEPDVVDLGTVSAAELGLSPLALVLTAQRPADGGRNELAQRIATVATARVADLRADDRIEVDEVNLLTTVAAWAAEVVGGSRALEAADFARGEDAARSSPGATDAAEAEQRVDEAVAAVAAVEASLRAARRTVPALRAALRAASEVAGADALPTAIPRSDDELALLDAQRDDVAATLADRLATVAALRAEPPAPAEDPLAHARQLLAAVLGAHQPLLGVVTLAAGTAGELAATLADRKALLGGDDTAPVAWLHRTSLVRPVLDPFAALLTNAEAAGLDVVAATAVAQLPHRPGARWCELPFGPEGPPPTGTVGIVTIGEVPNGAQPFAGLLVDVVVEQIPAAEHTAGIGFHYDAPGARPPQAIALAVHPSPNATRWDLDTLVGTVNEVAELAKLRTLSLKELEGFAGLLPALYLPNNYTRDVPAVSLKWLVEYAELRGAVKANLHVLGKK